MINRLEPGMLRIGSAASIPAHLRAFGVEDAPLLHSFGFDPLLLADPDSVLPYSVVVDVLNAAANASQCDHFGLLIGDHGGLDSLGDLGVELRKATSVADAINIWKTGYSSFDSGAVLDVSVTDAHVELRYIIIDQKVTKAAHLSDAVTVAGCRIMTELCGPQWTPSLVGLSRGQVADMRAYRARFDCPIKFDQIAPYIRFSAALLEQPVHHRLSERRMNFAPEDGRAVIAHIMRLCVSMMNAGDVPSSKAVSQAIAISERTLLRRLGQYGESFTSVLARTRLMTATRLIGDTDLALKDISQALGYSELSAFTRAFRSWTGGPPSRVRGAQHARPSSRRLRPHAAR